MKRKIYLVVLFNVLAFAFLAAAVGADPKPSGVPGSAPQPAHEWSESATNQGAPSGVQGSAPPSGRVGAAPQAPKAPVSSGFTYQGRLKDGNNPANGSYDLQFTLYDAASGGNIAGGPLTLLNQTVTDGLFTVQLDFGQNAFEGSARWLEIAVRQSGGGSYTSLSPLQALTTAPYAMSLRPGAVITGTLVSSPVISVTNTGVAGTGIWGGGSSVGVFGSGAYAVEGISNSAGGIGVVGSATAAGSSGVRGTGVASGVEGDTTNSSGYGVYGNGGASVGGVGVYGTGYTGASGVSNASGGNGVEGEADTGSNAYGVYGHSSSGNGVVGAGNVNGVYGSGVTGVNGTGSSTGVSGNGTTYGVYGTGSTGLYGAGTSTGIWGSGSTSGAYGVRGDASSGTGVYGTSSSAAGAGVYGLNNTNIGVYGVGNYGMYGTTNNTSGVGVLGESNTGSSALGVWGRSNSNIGVYGTSGNTGVYGSGNTGVYGSGNGYGVVGESTNGTGVLGSSSANLAGDFIGLVQVIGNTNIFGDLHVSGSCCSSQQGTYRIDDPLDPANKYLNQSAVESPDMLDVASGNVVLDAQGEATVTLPDWFQSANRDFRYQFAPIGAPAPDLYIAQEVQNNQFKLAGGKPGMKVSWQVTGVRQDAYANDHPLQVEQPKPSGEQGTYLYPKGYGQPDSKGLGYQKQQMVKAQAPPPVQTPDSPHGK